MNKTTTIIFEKSPSTTCQGFTDVHGKWIDGFPCLIEDSIQYFCCGTNTHRYCCPSDRYSFETESITDYSESQHRILTDTVGTSLINNQKLITKQFQQFQRYFLPVFLLTTTILFLLGIALWFWLYKHKNFYSLGQDDCIESRSRAQSDSMVKKRDSNHLIHSRTSTTAV